MNPKPYDGGVTFANGSVTLDGPRRAHWLEEFGSEKLLDLALREISGRLQTSGNRPINVQVESQLARKVADKIEKDARYNAAVASNANGRGRPADKQARMAELMRR